MKQKVKKVTKTMMALIITFSILLVSLIGLTVAYFTDNKSYTGTLEFGNVKLKVTDGSDVEMTDGGKIPFTFGEGREDATKLMPGDTVTINFKVSLQDNSEPAYYLVSLTDTKGVFASNTYFSDGTKTGDVLNIYVNDGTKTYLQSDSTQTALTTENMKYVGTLSGTEQHTFTIKAEIDPAYETQGGKTEVSLNIFAIQQANITEAEAYEKLTLALNGVDLPTVDALQTAVGGASTWTNLTSNGFYYTKDVPADYNLDTDLTTKLGVENIKVYKKSDTEIAFASDYKMNAPEDCSYMFRENLSLTSLILSNFNTRNVTNMEGMFTVCVSLMTLDLSNFDTSNVTLMSSMFSDCIGLKTLNVSSFNTSNVTNMGGMFNGCNDLECLDLNNFDTSNVTWMNSMFNGCSGLTTLDLSNFDTKNVINFGYMFNSLCSTSGGTLTIGDNFVISEVKATKATLNSTASLPTSVKVMRNGVEVTA